MAKSLRPLQFGLGLQFLHLKSSQVVQKKGFKAQNIQHNSRLRQLGNVRLGALRTCRDPQSRETARHMTKWLNILNSFNVFQRGKSWCHMWHSGALRWGLDWTQPLDVFALLSCRPGSFTHALKAHVMPCHATWKKEKKGPSQCPPGKGCPRQAWWDGTHDCFCFILRINDPKAMGCPAKSIVDNCRNPTIANRRKCLCHWGFDTKRHPRQMPSASTLAVVLQSPKKHGSHDGLLVWVSQPPFTLKKSHESKAKKHSSDGEP